MLKQQKLVKLSCESFGACGKVCTIKANSIHSQFMIKFQSSNILQSMSYYLGRTGPCFCKSLKQKTVQEKKDTTVTFSGAHDGSFEKKIWCSSENLSAPKNHL